MLEWSRLVQRRSTTITTLLGWPWRIWKLGTRLFSRQTIKERLTQKGPTSRITVTLSQDNQRTTKPTLIDDRRDRPTLVGKIIVTGDDEHRVTKICAPASPWASSSVVIDNVPPSSSHIRTATISRASAVVQQAPSSITSSAAHNVILHRGRSSFDSGFMGRTHRAVAAAPSRRLLVLTLSYCAASCSRP